MHYDRGAVSLMERSSARMGTLLTKNFIRLKRNIPLMIAQMVIPTFQAILFCIAIGGEPYDLPLAIVNMETDPSGKSTFFLEHLNSQTVRQVPFTNLTPAIESVERGENWGVLYIGETFTDSSINRYLEGIQADNETIEASTIKLYLDMTNQQISLTLYTKIMEGFLEFSRNMVRKFHQNPLLVDPPVVLQPPIYGHENPVFIEFMAPGMMLSLIYNTSLCLSTMVIIIEKKEGLLDRSLIAGVQSWEVIASILFPLIIIVVFQEALILICTFLIFNIPCLGSLAWVIISVFLAALEGLSFGLFVSSICNDQNSAMMLAMGTFVPSILLSGIVWPLEAMPYYVRYVSYCLPLTLLLNTTRCVMSRGWSITDYGIWDGYLVAMTWIIPVILMSCVFFKCKK